MYLVVQKPRPFILLYTLYVHTLRHRVVELISISLRPEVHPGIQGTGLKPGDIQSTLMHNSGSTIYLEREQIYQ